MKRDETRYHDPELDRMLENWRRYMTGEYRNPLDVKISSFYRQISESRASYRTSSEPMILGDFRDIDAAINALAPELQCAIRADMLERSATQHQKAWHCGLNSARAFIRRVDAAKRAIRATLNRMRQTRADRAVAALDRDLLLSRLRLKAGGV